MTNCGVPYKPIYLDGLGHLNAQLTSMAIADAVGVIYVT